MWSASDDLAARMPAGVVGVSESGLQSRADLERLAAAGYRAFLIGERFMTDPDPAAAIRLLLGEPARRRAAESRDGRSSVRMFLKICGMTTRGGRGARGGGRRDGARLRVLAGEPALRQRRSRREIVRGAAGRRAGRSGCSSNESLDGDRRDGGAHRASAWCSCTATSQRVRGGAEDADCCGPLGVDAALERVADGARCCSTRRSGAARGGTGGAWTGPQAAAIARRRRSCWPAA